MKGMATTTKGIFL